MPEILFPQQKKLYHKFKRGHKKKEKQNKQQ